MNLAKLNDGTLLYDTSEFDEPSFAYLGTGQLIQVRYMQYNMILLNNLFLYMICVTNSAFANFSIRNHLVRNSKFTKASN